MRISERTSCGQGFKEPLEMGTHLRAAAPGCPGFVPVPPASGQAEPGGLGAGNRSGKLRWE